MAGKKIITAVAGVLAFGGIIANSCVFAVKTNKLNDRLNEEINLRQAAEGSLLEVIEATKAELKTSISTVKTDLEQKITGVKTDLTSFTKSVTDSLKAVEAKFADVNETLELFDNNFAIVDANLDILFDAANELYGAVNMIIDHINENIAPALTDLKTQVANLKNTMNVVVSNLNYLISTTNSLIDYVLSIDEYVTLLGEDLEAVKESYATLEFVATEIANVMELVNSNKASIKAIEEKMNKFNGEEAIKLKTLYVRDLAREYVKFPSQVEIIYLSTWEAYGKPESGADKEMLDQMRTTALKSWENEIYSDWAVPGYTEIALAGTTEEAKASSEERIARIQSFLYPFEFLNYKRVTLNKLATYSVGGKNDTFVNILKPLEFSTSEAGELPTMEAVKEYLQDRKDRCDLVDLSAKNYAGLLVKNTESKAAVTVLVKLTDSQKGHYTDLCDAAVDFDEYMTTIDIDPLETTETTATDVEGVKTDITDEIELVVYCAEKYDGIMSNYDFYKVIIESALPAAKRDVENAYYMGELAEAVDFTVWTTATDDTDKTTVDDEKDNVNAALETNLYSATQYARVIDEADLKIQEINDYPFLTPEQKATLTAEIKTIADFNTYLDVVKDFGNKQELYAAKAEELIAAIDDLALIGSSENSMVGTVAAMLEAFDGMLEGYTDAIAYFHDVVAKGLVVYSSFDADNNLKEGITGTKAQENGIKLSVTDMNDLSEAVGVYAFSLMPEKETVDDLIDNYVTSWKGVFLLDNNNDRNDGQKVLDNNAEALAEKVNSLKYDVTLPEVEEYTATTAATIKAAVNALDVPEDIAKTLDDVKTALGGKEGPTGLYKEYAEEYMNDYEKPYVVELQETYLGEDKSGDDGLLREQYTLAIAAAAGDAAKITLLAQEFEFGKSNILSATSSKSCKDYYNATIARFIEIVGDYTE